MNRPGFYGIIHVDNTIGEIMSKATGKYKSSAHIKRVNGKKPHNFVDGVECKHCNSCDSWVALSRFSKRARNWDGLYDYCRECTNRQNRESYHRYPEERKARSKKWQQENKERRNKYLAKKYRERKDIVYEAYGNRCVICGFEDRRALVIDHVKGNGCQERKKKTGFQILGHIIRDGFPSDYQILCQNCNFIKAWENGEFNFTLARED